MAAFYKTVLREADIPETDKGIRVKDILPLIEGSEYELELRSLFDIEKIVNDVIFVPGAKTIVRSLLKRDQEFKKFDVTSNLNQVECTGLNQDNSLRLSFKGIVEEQALEILENDTFGANTKYLAKSDFLDLFRIDKYAAFCFDNGLANVIYGNLDRLKDEYGDKRAFRKRYRIIQDADGVCFVRAITSPTKYYNYNVRFSLFVTLLILHQGMKEMGHAFKVYYCEYDESSIKVYFEKNIIKTIKGLGKVRFQLEMVNDEIKREAMRFAGLSIIDIPNTNGETITIKPSGNKSKILTVSHGRKPATVYEDLKGFQNVDKVQQDMFDQAEQISKATDPDQLRYALYERIAHIKNEYLKEDQDKLTPLLKTKIDSLHELLIVMNKVEKLTTSLDAKSYLRYIFYDVLTSEK